MENLVMKTAMLLRGGLAALGILLVGAAAPEAQDTVDFSLAPRAGLKFKVVGKTTARTESTRTFGEREFSSTRETTTRQVFTQKILAVKEGRIVKIEREYEDATTRSVVESDRFEEPRERETESPLAWKQVRAEWKGEEDEEQVTVEIRTDDEWKEPDRRLRARLRPRQLRYPIIPLPREAKEVGASWELDSKELRGYFGGGRRGMGGRRGRRGGEAREEEPAPVEARAVFKLVEIADHRGLRCAVIRMTVTVSRGEMSTMKVEATCHYSLEHRIVVGMKGTGTQSIEVSRETERGSFSIESNGTQQIDVKVEILEAGES